MKVLFTGHRGFLGRELIPEIKNNCNIVFYEKNLQDFNNLAQFVKETGVEKIIHTAARGGRRIRVDSHFELVENMMISINVLRLNLPILTFCSGKIFGWQSSIDGEKEENIGKIYPSDFYGQYKFLFREITKDDANITFLRFFNIFGNTETPERFVKANLMRYFNKLSMQVHQDFIMDFFYAKDIIPVIKDWLSGKVIPRDINMVYSEKYHLTEVCAMINRLDTHQVPIDVVNSDLGKNYFGNGDRFLQLGYQLVGLEAGLRKMYDNIKLINNSGERMQR